RIARNTQWPGDMPDNFAWVRADLVDYWRLLLQENIHPVRHYILYPNPWPKIGHLARRWHGHAVFPTIVALGGMLECRSNWQIYIAEFAAALTQASGIPTHCESFVAEQTITPFERKYRDSGHALWRCRIQLPQTDTASHASVRATVLSAASASLRRRFLHHPLPAPAMCQLLGLKCSVPTDIVFSSTGFATRGGGTDHHADGWCIAFFEGAGVR